MHTACGRFFLSYLRLNQKLYSSFPAGSRCFGGSAPERENGRTVVLQEVARRVKPFGKVVVEVPCDVEIRPTDFDRYPDMNALLVRVVVDDEDAAPGEGHPPGGLLSVEVNDRDVWEVRGEERIPPNAKCLIESPVRYDVDVRAGGSSSVDVSGMVSDSIVVRTASGNITGEKLQAGQMILSSDDGGSVTLRRTLQGNIEINTVDGGTVRADKFLGTDLSVSTENGDVDIGSSYCTKSRFKTANGNLTLNNLHMDSTITIPGNGALNVLCLDGSLEADLNTGASRVRVVRLTGDSKISSNGDVEIVVPEQNDIQLNLRGSRLDVDAGINGMEEHNRNVQRFKTLSGVTSLDVTTVKSVKVSRASWADTLNLGRFLR
ncbi:protein FAM185A-like [Athalia rosae]|uniref:protein FAM185A-like n=1 Tax=Athalia rosae TaxID=37344 RepID=UPI00203408F2|nr:protein FAM185A-like [Athalia rosae]